MSDRVHIVRVGWGFESHAMPTNRVAKTFCGLPRRGQRLHKLPDGNSVSCLRCRRALIARGINVNGVARLVRQAEPEQETKR